MSPTTTWMMKNAHIHIELSVTLDKHIHASARVSGSLAFGRGKTVEEALANLMNVLMYTREN